MLVVTSTAFVVFQPLYSVVKNLSADVYLGVKGRKVCKTILLLNRITMIRPFFLLFSVVYLTPYNLR